MVLIFEDCCGIERSGGGSLVAALVATGLQTKYGHACMGALQAGHEPNAILALGPLLADLDDGVLAMIAASMERSDEEGEGYMRAIETVLVLGLGTPGVARLMRSLEVFCLGSKPLVLGHELEADFTAVFRRGELPIGGLGYTVEMLGNVAAAEMPVAWIPSRHANLLKKRLPVGQRPADARDICFTCQKTAKELAQESSGGNKDGGNLKACSRCKSAHFCGAACQQEAHASGKHRGCLATEDSFPPRPGPILQRVEVLLAAVLRVVSRLAEAGLIEEDAGGSYGGAMGVLFQLQTAEAHHDAALAFREIDGISMHSGCYSNWLEKVGLPALPSDTNLDDEPGVWSFPGDTPEAIERRHAENRERHAQAVSEQTRASNDALARKKYRQLLGPVAAAAKAFNAKVTEFLKRHYGMNDSRFLRDAEEAEPLSGICGESACEVVGESPSLVERWTDAMPSHMLRGNETARSLMAKLHLTELALAKVTPVGDWDKLNSILLRSRKKVNIVNTPPLQVGDVVTVHEGNNASLETVGSKATLETYFSSEGKWGFVTERGDKVKLLAGNLKRFDPLRDKIA
jgi:hypothetical protein